MTDPNQHRADTQTTDEQTQTGSGKLSSADIVKFIGLIAFLAITSLLGYQLIRFFGAIENSDNLVEKMAAAIREAGIWGVLVCLGLQFLQIVIAIIPGEIVQAAIGYVYGTVIGGLITLVGAALSSIVVFFLVRFLGAPFVQGMLGKQEGSRGKKIQSFLENHKRLNAVLFILYLIPGMPKDILTYIAPLTPIRAEEFIVLTTVARAPAIFATTFVVDAFSEGNYLACAIVAVVFGGMGLVGILFNMRIIEFVDKVVDRIKD